MLRLRRAWRRDRFCHAGRKSRFSRGGREAGGRSRGRGAAGRPPRSARRRAGRKPCSKSSTPPPPFTRPGCGRRPAPLRRDYLAARGLDQETIRRFRLGWAPEDRQTLRRALAAECAEPLLVEAGLLHQPEDGEPFDFFRGRVIFPIGDRAGRVIAFGGRVLGRRAAQIPQFARNARSSRKAACSTAGRRRGRRAPRAAAAIVTEGYMDVIALQSRRLYHGGGAARHRAYRVPARRSCGGSAPEPVLCFDGDAAGSARRIARAAPRVAVAAARPQPAVCDPAGGRGPGLADPQHRAGRPLTMSSRRRSRCREMLWEIELGAGPADTPERRADLDRRLTEDVALIADPTVRSEYRRFCARSDCSKCRACHGRVEPQPPRAPASRASGRLRARCRRCPPACQREILFRMLLELPSLIEEVAEEIAALDLPEAELDRLRREILEIEALRPGLDAAALRQHLLLNGFAATVDALFSPLVDSGFLIRRPASGEPRREWAHVIGMLVGGERIGVDRSQQSPARRCLDGQLGALSGRAGAGVAARRVR